MISKSALMYHPSVVRAKNLYLEVLDNNGKSKFDKQRSVECLSS